MTPDDVVRAMVNATAPLSEYIQSLEDKVKEREIKIKDRDDCITGLMSRIESLETMVKEARNRVVEMHNHPPYILIPRQDGNADAVNTTIAMNHLQTENVRLSESVKELAKRSEASEEARIELHGLLGAARERITRLQGGTPWYMQPADDPSTYASTIAGLKDSIRDYVTKIDILQASNRSITAEREALRARLNRIKNEANQ